MTAVHSGEMPAENDIRLNRELGGGALMDKGCYCVNTARFVMGAEPSKVYSQADFIGGVDARMTAVLLFPGNKTVQFETNFHMLSGRYCQCYEVFGESGTIRVPTGFSQPATYRHGRIIDTSIWITDNVIKDERAERIDFKGVHQYQLEAEYFADHVLSGKQIELPAENGVANTRVLEALSASAKEDRPVYCS